MQRFDMCITLANYTKHFSCNCEVKITQYHAPLTDDSRNFYFNSFQYDQK